MGREFDGVDGRNPSSNTAEILKSVYNNIENYYYTIMNMQSGFGQYMMLFPEIEDENDVKTIYADSYDEYLKYKINNGDNVDILVYDLGNYLKSFYSVNNTNEFDKFSDTYSRISEHYKELVEMINKTYTYIGTYDDDQINTESKNNFIFGEYEDDVFHGGAGNDYLQGDHGGDTYIFGRGYDTDTINASSDLNTIIIHNYRASSMINTRNAHNDLIINFGSADSTD